MAVPKGIRVRTTPDWFAANLCALGGFISARPNTHFLYSSIYNDSKQGYYLFIYGMSPVDDVNSISPVYLIKGTLGTQAATPIRVNPLLPAPPGLFYTLDNGASAIATTPTTVLSAAIGSIALIQIPYFILPPGYSIVVGGELATTTCGCGYWYIPMVDQSGVKAA